MCLCVTHVGYTMFMPDRFHQTLPVQLHSCKVRKCVNSFSESSRWLTVGLPGCVFVWVCVLSFPRGQLKGAFSNGATGGVEQGDSAIRG